MSGLTLTKLTVSASFRQPCGQKMSTLFDIFWVNFMQVNQLNNDEEINDRIFHALHAWSFDVSWANEAKGDGNGN